MSENKRYEIGTLDDLLKNDPEHVWQISYLYLFDMSSAINRAIANPILAAYKKCVNAKKIDKDFVISMFAELPFVTANEFYNNLCFLDNKSKSDVIESMEGASFYIKSSLLDSINKNNFKELYGNNSSDL